MFCESYVMLFALSLRAELLEVLTEFRSDRAEVCHFVDLGDQFKLLISEISSLEVSWSECLRIVP